MGENVWIFNHYAGEMFFEQGGRHHWFARELQKQGYEPVVFCCNTKHGENGLYFDTNELWHEHISKDDIRYVFIRSTPYVGNGKKRIKNMLIFAKNISAVVKQYKKKHGKPDVILSSSVHPFTVLAGEHIAKKLGVPCIVEIRDLWPESIVCYGVAKKNNILVKALYCLEKHIYTKADKIIFTMEGGKDYIIEKGWDTDHGGPVDLKKVHHINNGVDLEQFNYNKEHYTFADKDLDDENTFKIVYTGSIREANDLRVIVEVAEKLQEKMKKDIKFIIYGDGNQRKELEELCIEKGLDNMVFKGSIDKNNIPYVLSKANLNMVHVKYTNIMKYGCSLNKLFDYFASGKPIFSDLKVNYDLIKKYNAGIVIDRQNTEDIINSIVSFYEMDVKEYQQMCENSQIAAQQYDFKNLTKELIDLL